MFGGGQLGGSMAGSTVVERNLDRLTVIAAIIFMFTTILLGLAFNLRSRVPSPGWERDRDPGQWHVREKGRSRVIRPKDVTGSSSRSACSRWSSRPAGISGGKGGSGHRRPTKPVVGDAARRRHARRSAPSRSPTAPTGSPAARGSRWGSWIDAVPDDAAGLRHREGERRLETTRRASCSPGARRSTPGPPQTITYKINPTAVWSDGQPITSDRLQVHVGPDRQRQGHLRQDRLRGHRLVDDTDPDDRGRDLQADTSSVRGGRCSAATTASSRATSSQGKDRDTLMKNGYDWSGGPWNREVAPRASTSRSRRTRTYGREAEARRRSSSSSSPTPRPSSRRSSPARCSAIYPQPQLDAVDTIKKGLAGHARALYTADTGNIEALWMNNAKSPFDSVAVRQAVAYSIDRDAIVKRLFGDLGVTKASQTPQPADRLQVRRPAGVRRATR